MPVFQILTVRHRIPANRRHVSRAGGGEIWFRGELERLADERHFNFGDMTDNKTAVAFIFWLVALYMLWKNPEKRGWALVAATVLFLVYMIPHSMLGSEIDHTALPQ